MMVRTRIFQCAPILATALMVSSTANAYTPEQEQMCTGDAFRLCSSEIPDVDRVTACMIRNKAQLSPECRVQFGPPHGAAARADDRPEKPVSVPIPNGTYAFAGQIFCLKRADLLVIQLG